MLVAAFVLGLITQGAKIATDTIVQSSVDDGFRGRIFSVYDVLFNVAFVGAAAVAALMLPPDGRSVAAGGHRRRHLRSSRCGDGPTRTSVAVNDQGRCFT